MGGFAAVGVYDRSGEGNRAKMEQEADRYVTSFKELITEEILSSKENLAIPGRKMI